MMKWFWFLAFVVLALLVFAPACPQKSPKERDAHSAMVAELKTMHAGDLVVGQGGVYIVRVVNGNDVRFENRLREEHVNVIASWASRIVWFGTPDWPQTLEAYYRKERGQFAPLLTE